MNIFANYKGPRIPRRAYYSGVEKKVEMYPIKVKITLFLVWFYFPQQHLGGSSSKKLKYRIPRSD